METATVAAAARSALELLGIAVRARDDIKVQGALTDLRERLSDVIVSSLANAEKAASLQAALSAAERRKAELEAQIAERGMYELHEVRAGAFVYAAKQANDGVQQPPHYLCQACYDGGVKSILQRSMKGAFLDCLVNANHRLQVELLPAIKRTSPTGWIKR